MDAREVSPTEPASGIVGVERESPRGVSGPELGCSTVVLPAAVSRGVCFAHSYQDGGARGYGSPTSARSLDELRGLGATWVSLTPFGFMESLHSDEVRPIFDHPAGETDARVRAEIRAAHARGLAVQLKPHLWIQGGEWRARIDPGDDAAWTRWFDSYRAWLMHYAHLAAIERVEALVVGVELGSSVAQTPDRWRALIADVRRVFHGELLYAANWDAVDDVPFWDALDAIGVSFYAPLADEPGASCESMRARAGRALDRYRALSERVGRPLVLTEVGYRAASDGAVRPHEWPERAEVAVDERAQSQALAALLSAVASRSFVRGVFLWKWFTDPDTREEGPAGFSPRGKRAEGVLRAAYAPPRERSSSEAATRREAAGSVASDKSARPRRGASVER